MEAKRVHGVNAQHVAYVPVVESDGFGVGVACAEESGYVPFAHGYPTKESANLAAQEMNRSAGIGDVEARAVVICSMFRPGEYEAVLHSL